jgi:hypothetical protein
MVRQPPGSEPPLFEQKKSPCLPHEDGPTGLKEGLLAFGSSSSRAFLASTEDSGVVRDSSPMTVAGAASDFHGLPLRLNPKTFL